MNKPEVVHVDLDALVRDYLKNLNVTLRAFNAAEEFDFLSTFVPSDDPTGSLIDVVDLARDASFAAIAVMVDRNTFVKVDQAKLRSAGGNWRERDLNGRMELEFAL